MPKNRWERPATFKGDKKRQDQKRKEASVKGKKSALRFGLNFLSGRKR
jgi:hypothetical protein